MVFSDLFPYFFLRENIHFSLLFISSSNSTPLLYIFISVTVLLSYISDKENGIKETGLLSDGIVLKPNRDG